MSLTISRRPYVLGALSAAAGLAALLVGTAAVRGAEEAARSTFARVPVAARALAEGEVVAADDVRLAALPPDSVPSGVSADPVGRTVTIPLLAGDFVLEAKLAPSGRGVSALLLAGEVAATVEPAAPVAVAVGERVRVTATYDPAHFAGDDLVRVVAASARVVAVAERGGGLVVAVSPEERDRLALAAATARVDVAVLWPGG